MIVGLLRHLLLDDETSRSGHSYGVSNLTNTLCKATEAELARLPALDGAQHIRFEDKIIYLHFFILGCEWYVAEYDPREKIFLGFANLNNPEITK